MNPTKSNQIKANPTGSGSLETGAGVPCSNLHPPSCTRFDPGQGLFKGRPSSTRPTSSIKQNRREFLGRISAAGAGIAVLGPRLQGAPGGADSANSLVIRAHNANGDPFPANWLKDLFLVEARGDRNPLPHPPRVVENGTVRVEAPKAPFGFSFMLPVEGFGTVRLYADAGGAGYRPGQEVSLQRELAASRLAAVQAFVNQAKRERVRLPASLTARIEKARLRLKDSDAAGNEPGKAVPAALESLRETLWAGEEAVLARARQVIGRRGPRPGFLFGANFFGYPALGEEYAEKFAGLFNFATLPFYWRGFEPEEGKPQFDRVDTMLARLEKAKIAAKGHPLCWFHEAGCPKWMMGRSFEQWKEGQRRRITEIVKHYRGRIRIYDVINEAHDWGNDPQFSQEQLLEFTRLASEATRAADPQAVRVVNNCCLFGEYAATATTYKGKQPRQLRTPLQYLRALGRERVEYDAIGLQVYYPEHDLFEIARMLDRFATLGKPLHITELGVCSENRRDEKSLVKEPSQNLWHGPWSETIQADWIEQFYTLCYSHPSVEAITWWDFSDVGGHFWPHGGFIRPDGQPKESYRRLQGLIAKWNQGA